MMNFLLSLESWHWLSAGIFFVLLEALGTAGFLLGLGFGALSVALFMAIFPAISWQWQFSIFALMSVLSTIAYWRFFRGFNQATDKPLLNNKVAALIGQRAVVVEAIVAGKGKVQIQDALWTATAEEGIEEGRAVTIVGANGMELRVQSIQSS